MTPDTIIVFSAGTIPYEESGRTRWRTTTYDNTDAFGTLGGRDRVEAAALLAKKYPDAYIVTTSRRVTGELPAQAEVYAEEVVSLGVARERIIEETESINAGTQVQEAVRLATEKGWKKLVFVLSGFQIPRVRAFYEQTKSNIVVDFVSSESVLAAADPAFVERFAEIKRTAAYQTRLTSEARGLAAIKAGTYQSAPPEDKRER